ncbi:MAG: tRNA (adenosine(37)-N6)-dimethylallyltransferase MiaA [Clostridia bacterium]|nr:tRNA (adenosine(37)-N6)-dimethylallyltransferase MiaA [Clostridia bacterium]MBQ8924940.1 tRNA (adenosine(37)-N6)-dimethylallyltransferase MiaA [Clostridia bacterium]
MSNTERIPLVAVVGPTASGKTALAVELAKALDGEVLSFDSMQLYKGMDVATAKPTADEMQGIPHHLIDVVDPSETYSVARFQEDAARIIADIRGRGKNVILVGGTGLYLDSFVENLQFLDTGDATEVRARLKAELESLGPQAMYDRLVTIDPEYAEGLHPNNTGRVLRALEVYELTGYTMTYQIAQSHREPGNYDVCYIGLTAEDRDYLYDRINRRVDRMVENGLLDEARQWLDEQPGTTASQAIGIKEMLPYLQGEDTLEHCTEQLKIDTRHYAKRQLTWFRRNPDVHWLCIDKTTDPAALTAEALAIIEEEGIL